MYNTNVTWQTVQSDYWSLNYSDTFIFYLNSFHITNILHFMYNSSYLVIDVLNVENL